MLHHIKITILNEKINKNNTKNNPDSITSTKNKKKCIKKLVLVVFIFLQVKDDFMKVHQVLFNGNNVPIHTKGTICTAFPPVRLYAPSARISPKTTAKAMPQPQNHYWHCWRNHTSTSESLLVLLAELPLNLRITIGTVGGTTPQPQNHYWYCWRNYPSTSESLLALLANYTSTSESLLALLACNSIDGVRRRSISCGTVKEKVTTSEPH
jgi:hypothetical protein